MTALLVVWSIVVEGKIQVSSCASSKMLFTVSSRPSLSVSPLLYLTGAKVLSVIRDSRSGWRGIGGRCATIKRARAAVCSPAVMTGSPRGCGMGERLAGLTGDRPAGATAAAPCGAE